MPNESDTSYTRPRRGDICKAVVLPVANRELLVDLGVMGDGVIRQDDLHLVDEGFGGISTLEIAGPSSWARWVSMLAGGTLVSACAGFRARAQPNSMKKQSMSERSRV